MSVAPPDRRRSLRRWAFFALKALASAGLLYLAFRSVDLGSVRDRLLGVSPGWLVAAAIPFLAQILLQAIRWRLIAVPAGAGLGAGTHLRITTISIFFNQTLPSTVGGDAMRIWLSVRAGAGLGPAVTGVLLDRFVGLVALLALVAAALPWSLDLVADPRGRAALLAILSAGFVGSALFFLIAALPPGRLRRIRLLGVLLALSEAGGRLLLRPFPGAPVFGLSVAIHAALLAGAFLLARAMDLDIAFTTIAALLPPVILISLVPISIAGWGVREGAMIAAFGFAGIPAADALAFSVLFGLVLLAVGVIGGLSWLAGDRRPIPAAGLGTEREAEAATER